MLYKIDLQNREPKPESLAAEEITIAERAFYLPNVQDCSYRLLISDATPSSQKITECFVNIKNKVHPMSIYRNFGSV